MTDSGPLFGSYGLRSALGLFGQSNKSARNAASEVPAPVFGKRTQQPGQSISLREARLSYLHAELRVLFEEQAFPMEVLPFALDSDGETPRLLVGETLAAVERRVILQTLRHCHGNRKHAADMLGISLRTICNKLREYWRTPEATGGQP